MLREDWDIGERHEPGQRRGTKIDLPRMAEGGLDAEFFAVYVGQGVRTPEGYARAKERATRLLDAIHKMCKDYPQLVGLATSPEDAYRLEKEGMRAAFIGMENGYPIGKDLSLVGKYYERGIRYITLCHSSDNDICDSSTDRGNPENNGLSEFGKKIVGECNRLGIMVDISHVERATLKDLVDHIDYVVKLVGVDHVGIGTDFDGGGGVVGCDDVSEMPNITEELMRRGYSEEDIRKIWGGNIMRILSKVIETAEITQ